MSILLNLMHPFWVKSMNFFKKIVLIFSWHTITYLTHLINIPPSFPINCECSLTRPVSRGEAYQRLFSRTRPRVTFPDVLAHTALFKTMFPQLNSCFQSNGICFPEPCFQMLNEGRQVHTDLSFQSRPGLCQTLRGNIKRSGRSDTFVFFQQLCGRIIEGRPLQSCRICGAFLFQAFSEGVECKTHFAELLRSITGSPESFLSLINIALTRDIWPLLVEFSVFW